MMKNLLVATILFSLLFLACDKEGEIFEEDDSVEEIETFEESEVNIPIVNFNETYQVEIQEDVIYAEGLSHDSLNSENAVAIPLKLDIYTPVNDIDNRPLFMFIHGGAFENGTKQQAAIKNIAQFYSSRGWVFLPLTIVYWVIMEQFQQSGQI